MSWFLIFWLGSPTNYQIHSSYEDKTDCQKQQAYYLGVFDKVNTKMMADCVSYRFTKYNIATNSIIIKRYEFE